MLLWDPPLAPQALGRLWGGLKTNMNIGALEAQDAFAASHPRTCKGSQEEVMGVIEVLLGMN